MGMYTELNIGVNLRSDTPENIVKILKYMLRDDDVDEDVTTTDHPLFETVRWQRMLRCDSYYFDGHTDSSILRDEGSDEYELNVRCNLKNYDNEIQQFLDFIRPYLETEGFLGYYRYEEWEHPTLIYNNVYADTIEYCPFIPSFIEKE